MKHFFQKNMLTLSFFASFLSLVISKPDLLLLGRQKYPRSNDSPKISLQSFIKLDSFTEENIASSYADVEIVENELVAKNGSDYMINSDIHEVKFLCTAAYPVTWNLPFPEQFTGLKKASVKVKPIRYSTFSENMAEPETHQFGAYLYLTATRFYAGEIPSSTSGYLSCHSISKPSLKSEIYVYTEWGPYSLEGYSQTVQINVTSVNQEVILPCRPTHPSYSISLARATGVAVLKNDTQWVPVPLNPPSLTYDSRKGFIFSTAKRSMFGLYKCMVDGEEEEMFKYVKVSRGTQLSLEFKQNTSVRVTSRSVKILTDSQTGTVKCCSGDPSLGVMFTCGNEAECDLIKPVYMYDYLVGNRHLTKPVAATGGCGFWYAARYTSALFMCQSPDINVTAQFITTFGGNEKSQVASTTVIKNRLIKIRPNLQYDKAVIFNASDNISIDYKIKFQVMSIVRRRIANTVVIRPIPISRRIGQPAVSKITINGGFYYVHMMAPKELYEGGRVQITCSYIGYFFAEGAWLQLNWKNGTRVIFKPTNPDVTMIDETPGNSANKALVYRPVGYLINPSVRGVLEKLDSEMKSVDCIVPNWKSAIWEHKTLELNVKPCKLPEIKGPEEEFVTFRLNETNKVINCSVTLSPQERTVPSRIEWKKDDKAFYGLKEVGNIFSQRTENVSWSAVNFTRITHLAHGKFECIAQNVKGIRKKTFRVFVEELESTSKIKPIIITIGCTVAVTAILGVIVWLKKQKYCKIQLQIRRA